MTPTMQLRFVIRVDKNRNKQRILQQLWIGQAKEVWGHNGIEEIYPAKKVWKDVPAVLEKP